MGCIRKHFNEAQCGSPYNVTTNEVIASLHVHCRSHQATPAANTPLTEAKQLRLTNDNNAAGSSM